MFLHLNRNEKAYDKFYCAGGNFWLRKGAEDILEHGRLV